MTDSGKIEAIQNIFDSDLLQVNDFKSACSFILKIRSVLGDYTGGTLNGGR